MTFKRRTRKQTNKMAEYYVPVHVTGLFLSTNNTSNSNHRLKSAVHMPNCVLKRGDLCDRIPSRENEA